MLLNFKGYLRNFKEFFGMLRNLKELSRKNATVFRCYKML